MSPKILDSHIHLWPSSASNPTGHAWMTPGHILTKQHLLSDYFSISTDSVKGVVYVETDRRLDPPTPSTQLEKWTAEPIKELEFLRSIVAGEYGPRDSDILKGIVAWAPLHRGEEVFEQWLLLAERTSGRETWSRVKGFRFLLQAITDRTEFETLVFSDAFITILKSLRSPSRNFSFDVGVDMRSGGIWQLEAFAEVIERVHADTPEDQKTIFVLNHMCKPDFSTPPPSQPFHRWKTSMQNLSSHSKTYTKLSGAFSELPPSQTPTSPTPSSTAKTIAAKLQPWTDVLFESFGPGRIMFGSDWPVCNVKGPEAEKGSWGLWRDVVGEVLRVRGVDGVGEERVWSGTAGEAYRLDL